MYPATAPSYRTKEEFVEPTEIARRYLGYGIGEIHRHQVVCEPQTGFGKAPPLMPCRSTSDRGHR